MSLPRLPARARLVGAGRYSPERVPHSVRARAYANLRQHVLRGGVLPASPLDDDTVAKYIRAHAAPTALPACPVRIPCLDAYQPKMDRTLAETVRKTIQKFGRCAGWNFERIACLLRANAPAPDILDCLYEPFRDLGTEIEAKIAAACPLIVNHHRPALFFTKTSDLDDGLPFGDENNDEQDHLLAIEVNSPLMLARPNRPLSPEQTVQLGYAWDRLAAACQTPFIAGHDETLELLAPFIAEGLDDVIAQSSVRDGVAVVPRETLDAFIDITGGDEEASAELLKALEHFLLHRERIAKIAPPDRSTAAAYIEQNPDCLIARTVAGLHRLAEIAENEPALPEVESVRGVMAVCDDERGPLCAFLDLNPAPLLAFYDYTFESYSNNYGCALAGVAPDGLEGEHAIAYLRRALTEAMLAAAALDLMRDLGPTF